MSTATPETITITSEHAEKATADELFQELRATYKGLDSAEASRRLAQYGLNALEEKKRSLWQELGSYFWGPIPWMIEIAAILSIVVGHWADFAIITVLLVFNAVIGFWEEHKASSALEALKAGLALKARVLRDGTWGEMDAAELVPGDVIRLRLGDIIPADGKLIEGNYLSIDQAALTGESLPVSKQQGDIAYSGSVAKQGEMSALVTATGSNTFFGRTAKLVESAGAVSHFQQAVLRIGNFLICLAIALSIVLTAVELYRGEPILELLQFILILVIASIPVAMPAVLSVTMALGALALSKQKAIVSRLQSIEELAGVDILCSDKTGTLTKNQLTLGDPIVFHARDAQQVVLAGALASKAENHDDAIDQAVIGAVEDPGTLDGYHQKEFTPFDPISKRTEGVCDDEYGNTVKYTKGAPQVIQNLCDDLSGEERNRAEQVVADMATKGYRALGVAQSRPDGQWQFLGILPMFDPPRDDSAQTIAEAQRRGIEVKMVTGDNQAIAREISGQLGLGTHIQRASNFFRDGVDPNHLDAQAERNIEKADGFAEVFPEHKYGIVKALQSRGHLTAMTGDGVNDAPALKQADIGIAVSGATDAARSAASLILTKPGLSVIISAIEEARKIFARMMSYTLYRIAMTINIMFFVTLAILLFDFTPLTAIMIILLALLDDVPIMTIAFDNARIDPKPVRWKMGRTLAVSSVLGLLSVLQASIVLMVGWKCIHVAAWNAIVPMTESMLQSVLFLQLVVGGHLLLFVTRTESFLLRRPWPSWQLFWAIILTQVLAASMAGFGWLVPRLDWHLIPAVWAYCLAWMFILEGAKHVTCAMLDGKVHLSRKLFLRANLPLHSHQAAVHQTP